MAIQNLNLVLNTLHRQSWPSRVATPWPGSWAMGCPRPCPKGDRCRPGSRFERIPQTPRSSSGRSKAKRIGDPPRTSLASPSGHATGHSQSRGPRPAVPAEVPGPTWRERPGLIRTAARVITNTSGHDYPSHDRRDDQREARATRIGLRHQPRKVRRYRV